MKVNAKGKNIMKHCHNRTCAYKRPGDDVTSSWQFRQHNKWNKKHGVQVNNKHNVLQRKEDLEIW